MKALLSYFIIVLVTGVILGGGGYTLKVATEKETNLDYAAYIYKNQIYAFMEKNRGLVAGVSDMKNEIPKPALAENSCSVFPQAKVVDSRSIVDYFYLNGQDYSFENRVAVAKKVGMDDYRGTGEQNLALLNKLKTNTIACK